MGGIAIGRNEGERLRACLRSLAAQMRLVVYVDSGSTDGSVSAAPAAGAELVKLDSSVPFTAARGRNVGFERLLRLQPGLEYVQFADGDCVLDANWIEAGVQYLEQSPNVAAVCGRLREEFPDASIYNRLCDMEWNAPVGEIAACGGIFLIRASVFRRAGGFDPLLTAGEEPELCYRLRREGWRVVRLGVDMGHHDAAITQFRQWWKRMIRSGYAYAEGVARYGRTPERYNVRESLRIWLWALIVPAAAFAGAIPSGGSSLLLLLLYPAMVLRVAQGRAGRGDSWRHGLLYGVFLSVGRWAQLLGQIRYAADRLTGQMARSIEYKGGDA